jgi:SNF family Na+-dependent transporter
MRKMGLKQSFLSAYRDALITCVVNTLTCLLAGCVTFSILGHIALEQGAEVSDVVKSGPGLVFLTYPEVVLKLPGAPAWAAIFFSMLVVRITIAWYRTAGQQLSRPTIPILTSALPIVVSLLSVT